MLYSGCSNDGGKGIGNCVPKDNLSTDAIENVVLVQRTNSQCFCRAQYRWGRVPGVTNCQLRGTEDSGLRRWQSWLQAGTGAQRWQDPGWESDKDRVISSIRGWRM
jgi:hypothetical protein